MKKPLVVCNIDIHNSYGASLSEFYNRVRHLTQMRTLSSDQSFTYFITDDHELNRLKQLQTAVKTGRINFLDYESESSSMYVFALKVDKKILDWLYYSSSTVLEKQLIAWMAMMYFLNHNERELLDRQLHRRLLSRAKKLIVQRFSKYFDISSLAKEVPQRKSKDVLSLDELKQRYYQLCFDFYGTLPPYPLTNPIGFPFRVDEFGVIGPTIHFDYTFMYQRDWDSIVKKGIADDLNRAESLPFLINDWKEVITIHEIHAYHIYNNEEKKILPAYRAQRDGFIYLLSNKAFKENLYKIGYTTRSVEERVNDLYTTGVPCEFDIEFKIPVNNLYKIEKAIHLELKKYRFNKDREFFFGKKDKFIDTIRRFENFR